MRIGFDIDGVLANFVAAYQPLCVQLAGGVDLFWLDDINNPPCWDWPQFRGYTDEQVKRVWDSIIGSRSFWFNLQPHTDNITALAMVLRYLEHKHDVYFITSRPGVTAKRQTEAWIRRYLPYDRDIAPTVLLASAKGAAAKALKLDVYLDDNLDNAKDVLRESPKTRMYLLDRSYNQGNVITIVETTDALGGQRWENRTGVRVPTLAAMLDAELPNL
jgi:hypothetical protein